ncbi:MAG: SDR family oxidoreductase [Deltaproteobacteria bacterium]|nr:SDR family oxidoreductase [Deltaproteobacteria bacterium]
MHKKALVTGGTRGIGKCVAKLLSQNGFEVTVTGTCARGEAPKGCSYLAVDFSDLQAIELFAKEIQEMGFSVLINNAGINKVGSLSDYELKDFQLLQQVNVTAPFLLCRAVVPGMSKRKFGRIVNITSVFGVVSKEGRSAYSATKFALSGLTKALALETAKDNVLVNCLAPGFVDTELTRGILGEKGIVEMSEKIPMGRLATPEEMAHYVLFLASEENTYMTGQNVVVDGGFTCG